MFCSQEGLYKHPQRVPKRTFTYLKLCRSKLCPCFILNMYATCYVTSDVYVTLRPPAWFVVMNTRSQSTVHKHYFQKWITWEALVIQIAM